MCGGRGEKEGKARRSKNSVCQRKLAEAKVGLEAGPLVKIAVAVHKSFGTNSNHGRVLLVSWNVWREG